VQLYHQAVTTLKSVSNYIKKSDETIFASSDSEKALEFQHIRETLVRQKRWRLAQMFMKLEINHTSGSQRSKAIEEALSMCQTLASFAEPASTFRASDLGRSISSLSTSLSTTTRLGIEQDSMLLDRIKLNGHASWDQTFPGVAFENKQRMILQSQNSVEEKVGELLSLVSTAKQQRDYTRADMAYEVVRDIALERSEGAKGNPEAQSTLNNLRQLQEDYFNFHRDTTHLAYFAAMGLGDYLTTLQVRDHEYSRMLIKVQEFQAQYPGFVIPTLQERLLDHGIVAARKLGVENMLNKFNKNYEDWLSRCSFWSVQGLSHDAVLDPDFAFRRICHGTSDPIDWGQNAIGLMLQWAAHEWEQRLLSLEECKDIFGSALDRLPKRDPAESLRSRKIRKKVGEAFLGPPLKSKGATAASLQPQESQSFLRQCEKLLGWVLMQDRLPSRQSRLFALKILLKARLYRTNRLLTEKNPEGLPNQEQARLYADETRVLTEVEALESAAGDLQAIDTARDSAVHTALVKAFALGATGRGLASDDELLARSEDCRKLVIQYRNQGHRLHEYHVLCQQIRLTWQRYMQFASVLPEAVMLLVKEADAAFISIRNTIAGLKPPETLVAKAKLSDDFSHREHHNYALAGRYCAYKHYWNLFSQSSTPELLNKVQFNCDAFMIWAFKSKGRGFAEVLGMESAVGYAIEQSRLLSAAGNAQETDRDTAIQHPETSVAALQAKLQSTSVAAEPVLSPLSPKFVNHIQINKMLQSLPTGVVIVDFVDVRYAKSHRSFMVALVYRKGQPNPPVEIPHVSMKTIDKWTKRYLNVEDQQKVDHLSGTQGQDALAQLSGLLFPLFDVRLRPNVAIKPGETIVFCPTGSLNRVPLHAIPIGDELLIERNAVCYCQSLTILHWLWQKSQGGETIPTPKAAVINPMPDCNPEGEPTPSGARVRKLARTLNADSLHGCDLSREVVCNKIQGSSVFHYHGHVKYERRSALESWMALIKQGGSQEEMFRRAEHLTAKDLFKIELAQPALATVIGCGSGVTAVSSTDDVLGFPTALFYAGASAVVATLWPLDDEDGAAFSNEFYAAVLEQKSTIEREGSDFEQFKSESCVGNAVDLARAFQSAILKLRESPNRQGLSAPYHWASFTLNGYWLFPSTALPNGLRDVDGCKT
jgi:hypothetical protein